MGFFTKSTSKQTAKLKSLIKIAVTRLAVVRRPRLGRRSIARGDVAQLLSIGHLDRALLRAEQVIEEDNMLEVLDIIELYCKIIMEQATQLDKPKECSEEIKAAAAGLMFASARCGDLPELLDARAILADKFGRDFSMAAKEGSHGVVDPTLVQKLSGERASSVRQRRLAKEIAAENNILLDFPDNPREISQSKQSEPFKNVPAEGSVEQIEIKTENYAVQGRQRVADDKVNAPTVAQLGAEKMMMRRESEKQYFDVRMAAEAAFESASFAAMAARAAVELSRSESQGKGWRGSGYDQKVHPVQNLEAAGPGREKRPSWKVQKPPPPSPSLSSSDMSTVSSVGSGATRKGKIIVFDQSDEEDDDVVETAIFTPQLRQPPHRRTVSTVGIGVGGSTHGAWRGEDGRGGADPQPFQHAVPNNSQHAPPTHRRHASELGGGSVFHDVQVQGVQYRTPPYRRNPTANTDSKGASAARGAEDLDGRQPRLREGGAYESSAYVVQRPYTRIVSALEVSNEHIARHEEVRRIGTDARVLQERVYGRAPGSGGLGCGPLTPDRRAISVRTRK